VYKKVVAKIKTFLDHQQKFRFSIKHAEKLCKKNTTQIVKNYFFNILCEKLKEDESKINTFLYYYIKIF
jgi:hypothetical protein